MNVISFGSRTAEVMVVCNAPHPADLNFKRPLAGYSGDLFAKMCGRVGLNSSKFFYTHVCHSRPPMDSFDWFYLKKNQLEYLQGVLRLKADILEIKPKLVIALGDGALRALTGKKSLQDWRGSILPCTLVPGVKVIGTYSPAKIMQTWDYKAVAEFDLTKCALQCKFPEIVRPQREFILDPEPALRARVVQEMSQAQWLSVDIECWQDDSGHWRLACVGFSDRPDRGLVIPYDAQDHTSALQIQQLLECPAKKVLQNGNFDLTVLRDMGMRVTGFAWDTMLAHHTLYVECASGQDETSTMTGKKRQSALPKGLAFLTSIYTDEPRYKDDGKLWHETNDLQMFWRYNALDAMCTLEIALKQMPEIKEFGVEHLMDQTMRLCEPIMSATKTGIKIDLAVRAQLLVDYTEQVKRLQGFLDLQAGGVVNVSSSKQMQELLYGKLGLKPKVNRKTGRATANKDAIVELAGKYSHPLLMTILKIREKRVMLERYIGAPISADGRMRCSFDITGTRTARLASRASLDGTGTNFQNIPNEMRRMFIADPGKIFVYRDYAQADARVVAYLAKDKALIDLFNDPTKDIHKITASSIFNCPVIEVTYTQRFLGKKSRHALNYDMQAPRFVQVVNEDAETTGTRIDLALAKRVIDGFFMLHPSIKSVFWEGIRRELSYSRMLTNGFGRKRLFFGRYEDKLIRDAYSWIPQSTIGDLARWAVVRVYEDIQLANPVWGVEFLNQVHDSILVQCNEQYVVQVAEAMERAMHIQCEIKGEKFFIPSDCKVGWNWDSRGKDGDNPQGLRDLETFLKERASGTEAT